MAKLSFISMAGVFVLGSVAFGQQYEGLEEHELLKKDVGTWDADIKMWVGNETPMLSKGTEVNRMIGDLWTSSTFKAEFFGQKFSGTGFLGYDPDKKKYVGTWVDSTSPYPSRMEGDFDEKTKTLTMLTKGKDPSGGITEGKNETVYQDDKTRVFTMYTKQGGQFVKVMEMTYRRKK